MDAPAALQQATGEARVDEYDVDPRPNRFAVIFVRSHTMRLFLVGPPGAHSDKTGFLTTTWRSLHDEFLKQVGGFPDAQEELEYQTGTSARYATGAGVNLTPSVVATVLGPTLATRARKE